MIKDPLERASVAAHIGKAIDDLVREHMAGLVEEPDVTSRIAQRLEERLRRKRLAGHVIKVITQTIPSHGPKSLEKPTGTDLYIAISVERPDGNCVTKGILIQAKRRDQLRHAGDWENLGRQCRRMAHISQKGSFAWIYEKNGVDALKALAASRLATNRSIRVRAYSVATMLDEILECKSGDMRKVPRGPFGDRRALGDLVEDLSARNALWIEVDQDRLRKS